MPLLNLRRFYYYSACPEKSCAIPIGLRHCGIYVAALMLTVHVHSELHLFLCCLRAEDTRGTESWLYHSQLTSRSQDPVMSAPPFVSSSTQRASLCKEGGVLTFTHLLLVPVHRSGQGMKALQAVWNEKEEKWNFSNMQSAKQR